MNEIVINDLMINNINNVFNKMYSKTDLFCKRYYVYRYLLTNYLIKKLNLIEYDAKLKKSELKFLPIHENEMDFYQYFSKDSLNYFYVRNEMYLDNLSIDEVNLLDMFIRNFNSNNNEMMNFIEKTYKKVITKYIGHKENYKIFVGPDSINFVVNDGNVVVGIRYDEFNLNGYSDSEWNDIHDKQLKYLYEITKAIQEMFPKEVNVIKYNKYSVLNTKKDIIDL